MTKRKGRVEAEANPASADATPAKADSESVSLAAESSSDAAQPASEAAIEAQAAEADAAIEAAAEARPDQAATDETSDDGLSSADYSIAFSPRNVAVGLAIVAGLVAFAASRRRRKGRARREDG
jgi:hypothetical protein